jgi:hypothetical protein
MKYSSPSDYTAIAPSYTTGQGYYTNSTLVADLLQIPAFSGTTNPTHAQVGQFIKRTEDYIDEITDNSWRPILYINEVHNFNFSGILLNYPLYWNDYVGFIQLHSSYIRKMIRLEVWHGNSWTDLASATASVTINDYTSITGGTTQLNLRLPNSGLVFNLLAGTTSSRFDSTYGNKTAAEELVALINETYPAKTANLTGATSAKSQTDSTGAKQVSDYFYATIDYEDDSAKVVISSLLTSDDGANCSIYLNGSSSTTSASGLDVVAFTDKEEMRRLGDFWMIEADGKVFFRKNFPYLERQSVKVTYMAGSYRVPGIITDAATKLVACEILRHDDSTVLIADTGAQIDIKSKYDLLKAESKEILDNMKETIFLIE